MFALQIYSVSNIVSHIWNFQSAKVWQIYTKLFILITFYMLNKTQLS